MKPMTLKERVYAFCDSNFDKGKFFVAKHFFEENIPKTTIYRLIKSWEDRLPSSRKSGSGRKPTIMTKSMIAKLRKQIDHRTLISTRNLAKKLKCSQRTIVRTINNKTDIQYRKRISAPHRTEKQISVCQSRCRRLFLKFHRHDFVMDDESYFTFSHSDKNSIAGFWTSDIESAPNNVKFKTKQKFEKKLLVWVAISPRGISSSFIAPSGLAVNQDVYLKECIIKRLIPFINKYHADNKYVFWPDLASSHYAKSVVSFLDEKKIVFVSKADNPPAVPELRPIENFWSILKGLVYENGWVAQNSDQLINRIKFCLKKVDLGLVQCMCSSVPKKLDHVRRYGIE